MIKQLYSFIALIAITFCAGMASAQSTSTIAGTVKDPTGAVLPGAQVTARSAATGAERVVTSDNSGSYIMPSLQPGEYTLTVTAPGFAVYTIKSLMLQVDQHAEINIPLSVASSGQTVEVTSVAPVIDAGSITVGQVIDKVTVQEIPLNGRHFLDLTTLTPGGVTAPAAGSLTAPSRGVGAFSFNTAGNREDSVNFQINGINLNDIANAQIVFQPSINTTSEVKIDNSTFSAEYGRNSGSIVNVSTRSGASKFHGELFEYTRNNSFDARNFFDPAGTPQASLKRNNFGVAAGGPIWKDKTFFFASYEALRQHQGLQLSTTVPSLNDRAGVTDAVMKSLLPLIPTSTAAGPTAKTYNGLASGPVNIDQGTMDVLQNFSSSDMLHVFYAYQLDVRTEPTTQGNTVGGFGDHRPGHRQILTVNETHVFSPRLVNEFRAGYNRVAVQFINNFTDDPTKYGFNNYPSGVTPSGGIPFTTISGYGVAIGGPGGFPSGRYDTLGVLSDAATYTIGKHSIKFGGEGRRYLNTNFSDDAGTLSFSATPTLLDANGNVIQTGQTAIQNFQSGNATGWSITPQQNTSRIFGNAVGAFIMDTYKVTPNVSIEAGFRFEWLGSPTFGGMKASVFDPVAITLNPYGSKGYSNPYSQNYNYMPRIGFTYDMFGNSSTVIRGGYSILSDQPLSGLVTGLSSNPPYTSKVSYTATTSTSADPATDVREYSAANLASIPVESLYASAAAASISVSAVQPGYKNATTQSFNLNLQRALPGNAAISIGYYGNVGRHLRMGENINQISPETKKRAFTRISADSPIDPNVSLSGNVTMASSNGMSNYNALWVQGKKNMSHGFEYSVTWQYSKAMDEGSLAGTQFTDITQPALNYGLSDYDTRHRISGNGIYALPFKGNRWVEGFRLAGILQWQTGNPLNITTTSTYTGTSGVQHPTLLGAIPYHKQYRADGLVNWYSAPSGSTGPSGLVCGTENPAPAGCVFYTPSAAFGTMQRNGGRGPGFTDFDMSLYKDTKIFERLNFQLRLDAFDVFNHPSFGNPGNSAVAGSSSFGVITSTRFPVGDLGSSRQLQIAGKFIF